MRTAEKRAQLEAAGEPWPTCQCHHQPAYWQADRRVLDGGYFKCAKANNAYHQRRYEQRVAAGLCTKCSEPAVTQTLCGRCADALTDRMQTPKAQLGHYLAATRYNMRRRGGGSDTGMVRQALAKWVEEAS